MGEERSLDTTKKLLIFVVIVFLLLSSFVLLALYTVLQDSTSTPSSTEEAEFSEENPAWNMTDLAIDRIMIEPERTNPNSTINLSASIRNSGPVISDPTEVIFLVDGSEAGRADVVSLRSGAEAKTSINWVAQQSGRHYVTAKLTETTFDSDLGNNIQTDFLRVSGGPPEPELEIELPDIKSFQPIAGESYNLTLTFYNPSFVDIGNIPIVFRIDGEVVGNSQTAALAGGERQDIVFQWLDVTPGEHIISAQLDLPDNFPYADSQKLRAWQFTVPSKTVLYDALEMDKWNSIGPKIITPGNWVGCINMIALHPNNKDIMYAASRRGGVWKTENAGDSWAPLTDTYLPFYIHRALAVDKKHPDIVYFGTTSEITSEIRIYKSINGGNDWSPFANETYVYSASSPVNFDNVYKIATGYVSSGTDDFVIYAATSKGVFRYKSDNPWAISTLPSEWEQIKIGKTWDIIISPDNPNVVYISVEGQGVFYTTGGLTAKTDSDWTKIPFPVITPTTGNLYTIDVYWGSPRTVFAAIGKPQNDVDLGIYKNAWPHTDDCTVMRLRRTNERINKRDILYNPFVRVNPKDPNIVYFSGVYLHKNDTSTKKEVQITGIHADLKWMTWSPHEDGVYYVTSDGGICRCTTDDPAAKFATDTCVPINTNLSVTEFYDFDASKTNSKLMIGGTQDCGTIMWEGSSKWKCIRGGDGGYSLIGHGDQIFYSQHQYLASSNPDYDMMRSGNRGTNWVSASGTAPFRLPEDGTWKIARPFGNSYITVHPLDANEVLAQGNQVYFTEDGGATWETRGPYGKTVKGFVRRIVIKPETSEWFVGTDEGQIWKAQEGGHVGFWSLVDQHPYDASIVSMAFAPTNPNVLYVAYSCSDPYFKVQRLVWSESGVWMGTWVCENLPDNIIVNAVAGNGYSDSIFYIGTNKGVYRGDCAVPTYDRLTPYNDGLPLIEVTDLLIDSSKQLRAATYGRGAWVVVTTT